jgi:predicted transcriptional regulator
VADTSPIPVRLSKDTIIRLDRVAQAIGSNRAAVMRMLVEQWLGHYESKGKAVLPVNFEDVMKQLDGRTHRYSTEEEIAPVMAAEDPPEKVKKSKPKPKK